MRDTPDQDLIYVGRIREDDKILTLTFFCCGDQIRKECRYNKQLSDVPASVSHALSFSLTKYPFDSIS